MFCTSNAFSQGINWRLNGNNNVKKNDFIGTKNNADFVIRTNNQERIRVTTDNYTVFKDSVRIKGPLYIGDSSLIIGQDPIGTTDNIQSTAGKINFGGTPMFNFLISSLELVPSHHSTKCIYMIGIRCFPFRPV
ncbi:MAG: hypothetical protein QM212_02285 [Bacteroidota bacterium]|nr:hypothetical protein [Bacteroidota bacterium]